MFGDLVFALGDWRDLKDLIGAHKSRAIVMGVAADAAANGAPVELCADLACVLARDPQLVLYLDPDDAGVDVEAIASGCRHSVLDGPVMMFCVPARSAPVDFCRMDGRVSSFVCAPDILLNAMSRRAATGGQATLCYHAVFAALEMKPAAQFHVLGQTARRTAPLSSSSESVAVVIPHRGELRRLEACLKASTAACPEARFFVGFDEDMDSGRLELVDAFPKVMFFSVAPTHVGPYVIRQFLIEHCDADFVAFQDSDDLSCVDRLQTQISAARTTRADIIGCHEIRIEEGEGVVQALRYPLDVNAALENVSAHCQLSPTMLARREVLLGLKGFSTRRRYASDREFLLRANLTHRIANCDEFLYVRFRHSRSLTMSPKSAPGSRYRKSYTKIWERDAIAVRNGAVSLASSALRPHHLHGKTYRFTNLRTGRTHDFRPGAPLS